MRSPARLLLVALAASLASCNSHSTALNEADWWRQEGERQSSEQKLALLTVKVDRAEAARQAYDAAAADSVKLDKAKAALIAQRADLAGDISDLTRQVDDIRQKWIAATRSAATGRTMASISARDGRTYQNITISKVTDVGIEFRHANGSGRLSATDLTPQQLDAFGIEAADALIAHQQEQADAHAYAQWVDGNGNDADKKSEAKAGRTLASAVAVKPASGRLVTALGSRSRLNDAPRTFSARPSYTTYYSNYYYPTNPYCGNSYYAPRIAYGRAANNPPRVLPPQQVIPNLPVPPPNGSPTTP
jgi:hypothetical protein